MPISPRESEIQKLVRFYRKSIRDLGREFVASVDFEKPGVFAKIQSSTAILQQLEDKTRRWADKNIAGIYKAASKEAAKDLAALGLDPVSIQRARGFNLVNERAIQALMNDPTVGFVSGMQSGIGQIKDRMTSIRRSAKLITGQQKLLDEVVARVGFLEGRSANTIRDRLVDEMVGMKDHKDLLFTANALKLPPGDIVRNTAELPFVKIPSVNATAGFRRLRVDKYAEMLARTKTSQASNLARRNKAMEHGVGLMQISKNLPLHDDACILYIGKVFALTQSAKDEFGVPLLQELPNGGAPFHPNCTHQELQFVIGFRDEKEIALAMQPPPAWALNRPWAAVQKEFERGGGKAAARKANAAVSLGRTTGGRDRRGTRGEDFGPDGPQPPKPTKPPKPPTAPEPKISPDALSGLEKSTERTALPGVESFIDNTGSEFVDSIEGVTGEIFERKVIDEARRSVDRVMSKVKEISSSIKERVLRTSAPRIAKESIQKARVDLFIKKSVSSVKNDIHRLIVREAAMGTNVRKFSRSDSTREFISMKINSRGPKISKFMLDASIESSTFDSAVDSAMSEARRFAATVAARIAALTKKMKKEMPLEDADKISREAMKIFMNDPV